MKKFFFILCLHLTLLEGWAQEYEPIVDTTKMWVMYQRPSWEPFGVGWTAAVRFQGESIFDTVTWKNVLYAEDSNYNDWSVIGYIREESKVVTYMGKTDLVIDTLYDFNKTVGDQLDWCSIEVAGIDSFEIAGKRRLRQEINDHHLIQVYHYEGLGSNAGILGPYRFCSTGLYTYLVCYYKDGELLYMGPDFDECYFRYTSITESLKENVKLTPNPAYNEINVDIPEGFKDADLLLFDILGRPVSNFRLTNGKNNITIGHLPTGLYAYIISYNNQIIKNGKLIKN